MTAPILANTQLFDKVYGCLVGGAIGDAMGGPSEGLHYQTITQRFGQIAEPLPYRDRPAGTCTDDTALRNLLAEAIIAKGGHILVEDLAAVWRERMDPTQFYVPIRNSFYKITVGGVVPREAGHGNMLSNSSVMSIAPIGILNAGDPARAVLDAYEVTQLSHSGFSQEAACVIAAAIAAAFIPGISAEDICTASTGYLPAGSAMAPYVERALALARECADDYPRFRSEFYARYLQPWPLFGREECISIDPREAVPAALAIFALARGDPAQAIPYGANFGRDADTIATMAGSIAGTFRGATAIPSAWIETVERVSGGIQRTLALKMTGVVVKELEAHERLADHIRSLLTA